MSNWRYLTVLAILLLFSCTTRVSEQKNQNQSTQISSPVASSSVPITNSVTSTLLIQPSPPTATPTPTIELSSVNLCLLVVAGKVEGRVFLNGKPIFDDAQVSLVSSAGPALDTRSKDSYYSFPMLARRCTDGIHWISFQLRAAHDGKSVEPDRADLQVNFSVTTTEEVDLSPDKPSCKLVMGTISGNVTIEGKLAPDGTLLLAALGARTVTLENALQAVTTKDGRYSISSIGNRCGARTAFLQWTLSSLGKKVTIMPKSEMTLLDVVVSP